MEAKCVHLNGLFSTLVGNPREKRSPRKGGFRMPGIQNIKRKSGLKVIKKAVDVMPQALEYGKLALEGAKTIGNV